jgi:hypothetical protein
MRQELWLQQLSGQKSFMFDRKWPLLISTLSMKYFSDFSISYRRRSLGMTGVSGLKATKGISKAA